MIVDRLAWGMLALVHTAPAIALVRPRLVTKLYGTGPTESAYLLLHHRAALFAVIVLVSVWAMFDSSVQRLAAVSVAISMMSFLILYAAHDRPRRLRKIAIADMVALPALAYVTWQAFANP